MKNDWRQLLREPTGSAHIVQIYQDEGWLVEAVEEYIGSGLRDGDAAVVIATAAHRQMFLERLKTKGVCAEDTIEQGALRLLDADATLETFMAGGMPHWQKFHQSVGGLIAEMRLQFPSVRAYGEMVNLLWQRNEHAAAIRLEEFWNELGTIQTFSLFCAYHMDNLDSGTYGGPLECVCKAHTHLIPARNYQHFNDAVEQASNQVLGPQLAGIVRSMSADSALHTDMPRGQAILLCLKKRMPRLADKILAEVRQRS